MPIKTVIVSGYFNPLHNGHLDLLESAAFLGDRLVVIVNSDLQVGLKGSCPLLDEKSRLRIIRALHVVDLAMLAVDKDGTVVQSLHNLRQVFDGELVFANGGDRETPNEAEAKTCEELGIKMIFGLGIKQESSSQLIDNALGWKMARKVEELLQK